MQPRKNIAARFGHWSANNRKKAIGGWIAFVIVSMVIGSGLGMNKLSDEDQGVGESGRAEITLSEAFPATADEAVLIQSAEHKAGDPEFRAVVQDLAERLEGVPAVVEIQTPYGDRGSGQISGDGHSALVSFELDGNEDELSDEVAATLDAGEEAGRAHPGFEIGQFGDATATDALSKAFEEDFKKAETMSLPITLVILVVAFGAILAAGIPLLLALSSVMATLGLVGVASQVLPVSESISSVILLIGLAVGVDYSMFYLRREREERAAGKGAREALETAAATSGRTVLISGLTVMVAMAGLFLTGNATFESFGVGTILVVGVAVLGSLTVLPAVLAWLGDRVEKGRVPLLTRRSHRGESRVWSAVLDRVLRRPLVSAAAATALLVALTIPAFGMQTALPGVESYPRDVEVMQVFDRMQEEFPGGQIPAVVVVEADDVRSAEVSAAIEEMRSQAIASGLFQEPVDVRVSDDGTVASVSLSMDGDGTDERSNAALDELRDEIVPATVERVDGAEADVAGMTAGTRDFSDQMTSTVPYVFGFVLSMAFVLLLVTFRSIVIPLKAIALNLLSVGAAYGVLVLVFQHGFGDSLLGFESTGAITSWLPVFMFVVLFGLSMDYHVFILSRIREAFDSGMSTEDAVAHGIKRTAGVVTSAAVVMVAVFGIFAVLDALEFKQMGVGLAVAILIDATIVRGVLLPAAMKLLGDSNWYLPKRLGWLPKLEHERAAAEPARA